MKSYDAIDQADITFRQLDYWVRKGYIKPRRRKQQTSGIDRDFTDHEAAVLCRMARLIDRGFTPRAAARIARVTPGVVKLGKGITLQVADEPQEAS